MRDPVRDRRGILLWLLAIFSIANGLSMLAGPLRWYHAVLEPVPALDLITEHFVRDVGCAFLTAGIALAWAAYRPSLRAPLVGVATVFFVLHAALHVFDTARGYLEPHHWLEDLPGVYLPALLLAALSFSLYRSGASAQQRS